MVKLIGYVQPPKCWYTIPKTIIGSVSSHNSAVGLINRIKMNQKMYQNDHGRWSYSWFDFIVQSYCAVHWSKRQNEPIKIRFVRILQPASCSVRSFWKMPSPQARSWKWSVNKTIRMCDRPFNVMTTPPVPQLSVTSGKLINWRRNSEKAALGSELPEHVGAHIQGMEKTPSEQDLSLKQLKTTVLIYKEFFMIRHFLHYCLWWLH